MRKSWSVVAALACFVTACVPAPSPSPGKTAEPTASVAPSASQAATLPDGLTGLPWLAESTGGWLAGRLGEGSPIAFPFPEVGLEATRDFAFSFIPVEDRFRLVARRWGSEQAATIETASIPSDGLARGGALVWTSVGPEGDAGIFEWLPPAQPTTILPAGPLPAELAGQPPFSARVYLATADEIVRSICDQTNCIVEAVAADGDRRTLFEGAGVLLAGRGVVLLVSGTALVAFRAEGDPLWTLQTESSFLQGYLTSDGETLIQGSVEGTAPELRSEIAAIEVETGRRSVLFSAPEAEKTLHLMPELSTDRYAALSIGFTLSDTLMTGGGIIRFLDVSDGRLLPDAFQIAKGG